MSLMPSTKWTGMIFKSNLESTFKDIDEKDLFVPIFAKPVLQTSSVYKYTKVFRSVILKLGNKAPDNSAQLFIYVKGFKPAVKT